MMLHSENKKLGWSWAVAHWVPVASWSYSALLWQKEASDIPSKSELLMFLHLTQYALLPDQILCINIHPAKRYMLGKTTWYSIDVSGNDRHILLVYKKYHFCHLLPFAKVGQYSPRAAMVQDWYSCNLFFSSKWTTIIKQHNIPESLVQRRIWTWSLLKCFWRALTWFHNNRYYNGTIYITDNVIVLSDLVESSGYSSKTLKKGWCPIMRLWTRFYGNLFQ